MSQFWQNLLERPLARRCQYFVGTTDVLGGALMMKSISLRLRSRREVLDCHGHALIAGQLHGPLPLHGQADFLLYF